MWGVQDTETRTVIEFPEERAQARQKTWLRRYPAGELKFQRLFAIVKLRALSLFGWGEAGPEGLDLLERAIEGVVRRNVVGDIEVCVAPDVFFLTIIASDATGEYHYGVQLTPEMFHDRDATDR